MNQTTTNQKKNKPSKTAKPAQAAQTAKVAKGAESPKPEKTAKAAEPSKRFGVASLYQLMGRTPMPQAEQQQVVWHLVDAEGLVLGRMAAHIVRLLRGKHNPWFTPHYACGDKVIVINAEKVALTGKKMDTMLFHWHTGYPGGLKVRKAQDILEGKRPERLVIKAIERMMKHGPLGRRLMKNLYVYTGSEHPHQEAKPNVIDMRALNNKNAKRSLRVS